MLLSGLQPDRDIDIQFTGLRPGEKLLEELNMQDECLHLTSHPKIKSYSRSSELNANMLNAYLQKLHQIADLQDVSALILLLKELIPDYNPGSRLLKTDLLSNTVQPEQVEVASFAKQ